MPGVIPCQRLPARTIPPIRQQRRYPVRSDDNQEQSHDDGEYNPTVKDAVHEVLVRGSQQSRAYQKDHPADNPSRPGKQIRLIPPYVVDAHHHIEKPRPAPPRPGARRGSAGRCTGSLGLTFVLKPGGL